MKKENLGGFIMAGSIIMAMLIILLHGLKMGDGETHKADINNAKEHVKIDSLTSAITTTDTIDLMSNDAVLIRLTYSYIPIHRYDDLDVKSDLKEFISKQNYLYYYNLELPYVISNKGYNDVTITNIEIEEQVLARDKFIHLLVSEVNKGGWKIHMNSSLFYSYIKDNIKISVSTIGTLHVTYKGNTIELTKTEESLLLKTISDKGKRHKLSEDKRIREEFIKEFDTK